MEKPKDRQQVYAVVRHDFDCDDPKLAYTVKEVVASLEIAQAEAERLNKLNSSKGVVYWWQTTRLYPDGSAAGPLEP